MEKIAIIGTGAMGVGIAHVFANAQFEVNLIGLSNERLTNTVNLISKNLDRQIKKEFITESEKEKALANIKTFTILEDGLRNVDIVIEAITENKEKKIDLFKKLGALCPPNIILASNTSSISLNAIASVVNNPERVIGIHFMNPVPIMKLVEIINAKQTKKSVTSSVVKLCEILDKIPVVVNDAPGFIANRILIPMINEAILCVEQKTAGVTEIDSIMKLGMAHPMGPLQLADLIGLDVCHSILEVMKEGLGEKYKPAQLLTELVNSGRNGVKSGEGFYIYNKDSKDLVVSEKFRNYLI